MARILYGALVESIRGSIGGTTFQANKYGYTVKRKPNMTKPNKPTQNRSKSNMSKAVKAWRDLSAAQRTNWDTFASTYPQYAKHNASAQLSGFNVFVKWHNIQFLYQPTVKVSPDMTIPDTDTLTYGIIVTGGVMTIDVDSTTEDEEWGLAYFVSRRFSDSQNFIGTKTRFVKASTNVSAGVTITSEYTALYGTLPSVGDRVALDVVQFMLDGGYVLARTQEIITVTAS